MGPLRWAWLGDCSAAGRRTRRPHDPGPRLDLQDQPAVAACRDRRLPADPAHRADDGELRLVALAARGPRRVDQRVPRAIWLAGRKEPVAGVVQGSESGALLESDAGARLAH